MLKNLMVVPPTGVDSDILLYLILASLGILLIIIMILLGFRKKKPKK